MQDLPDPIAAKNLRQLLDGIPIPLSTWSVDLTCRCANSAFERLLDLADGTWSGLPLREALGERAYLSCETGLRQALLGETVAVDLSLACSAGGERRCRVHCHPELAGGVVTGLVMRVEDMTDTQLAADHLRSTETLLDRTGRVAGVGGWEVDLRTRRVTWSDRTRRIHEASTDYSPTLEEGLNFYAVEARPVISGAVRQAIEHGDPWDLELPLVTARGRAIWVRTCGEVDHEDGMAVRLVGAFQDVTDQRQRRLEFQQEQALRLEMEAHAEALDRLLAERDEMLSVLAHEVRQPLNNASASLQSAAQVLAEFGEKVASRRLRRAQVVMGQVIGSIDNTLAVASLLAGNAPIRPVLTEVDTLLSIAIADMPESERSRIRVDRLADIRSISMDMGLMRLALRNLLSNALKFSSDDAAVVIRLSDSDDPPGLVIDVIDSGNGIPPDRLARLFERGTRVEPERNQTRQGMGLGLYIVRRVMELHGGRAELAANGPDGAILRLVVSEPQEP